MPLTTEQIAAFDALRRTPEQIDTIMRAVPACGVSRTLRVASAFASGGMLRTDVCMKPRGHKGEHQA